MLKFISSFFVVSIIFLSINCTSVTQCQSITQKEVTKIYTCTDACYNYHSNNCTSPIDTCGFSCENVCAFFRSTIVTDKVLTCLSTKKTCKNIFRCVGY